MTENSPVVIVGAGIAGLAAAAKLSEAGIAVVVFEGRDRIGGRIFTQHDAATGAAIELGAEFIHGLAPEIWAPLRESGSEITEVSGQNWCVTDRGLSSCDFLHQVDEFLNRWTIRCPTNPSCNFSSGSFGRLSNTRNGASAPGLGFGEPRNVQLALKLIF